MRLKIKAFVDRHDVETFVPTIEYEDRDTMVCLSPNTAIKMTASYCTPIAAARAGARKLRTLANELDRQAERGFKGKWGREKP